MADSKEQSVKLKDLSLEREKEFFYCNKYGLVRNYKMETDFMISAKQVEEVLKRLDQAIEQERVF